MLLCATLRWNGSFLKTLRNNRYFYWVLLKTDERYADIMNNVVESPLMINRKVVWKICRFQHTILIYDQAIEYFIRLNNF